MLNPKLRDEFPILEHVQNGKKLVYLDNTATTQKPLCVIDRINTFYKHENATVHRGVYGLSQVATDNCEAVRKIAKDFINAKREEEVIFVKGTTEAINLIAKTYGKDVLVPGSEILITEMEHHANIVPWQQICEETGAVLKVCPINDKGDVILEDYIGLLNENTKIVSFTHVSNVLGTINPIHEMTKLAKDVGATVVIDGAQAVSHIPVDVQDIGCDFYCFSAHKMHGPTGVGVLWGRYDLLCEMRPYESGGDMIDTVTFEKTTYAAPPSRFEPGTPAIAQIIGLGEAFKFLSKVGLDAIAEHEHVLLEKATTALKNIDGLRIIGEAKHKNAVISFVLDGVHPHDAGTIMDTEGVAVRVGHHCAQPLMQRFQVPATIRASFSLYNTEEEIDRLVDAIKKVQEIML
jgi:cysteine desulfurase/selenocysteine lyase